MASVEAISISKIIIGVANTIGMPGTKCPTVRSAGTTSVRSALMPMVMKSRASMGLLSSPLPPVGEGGSIARSAIETGEGYISAGTSLASAFADRTPHPPTPRSGTFSHKRRRKKERLLLRSRRAFHKRLAALHLVGQRRFVDLDHDRIGIDAEVLHQRLGDVAHHAGLLFVAAAEGHAHGNLRHRSLPLLLLQF